MSIWLILGDIETHKIRIEARYHRETKRNQGLTHCVWFIDFPLLLLIRDSNGQALSKQCKQRAENIDTVENEMTQTRFLIVAIAAQILEVIAHVTFNNAFKGFE